jgi:hypothetical protein
MVSLQPGDAFLMQTPTGFAFGAVIAADEKRDVAFVIFQSGASGTAASPLVRYGMQVLATMATEVKA